MGTLKNGASLVYYSSLPVPLVPFWNDMFRIGSLFIPRANSSPMEAKRKSPVATKVDMNVEAEQSATRILESRDNIIVNSIEYD